MTDAVDFTDQVFRFAVCWLVWMTWFRITFNDSKKPGMVAFVLSLGTFVVFALGVGIGNWIARLLWGSP